MKNLKPYINCTLEIFDESGKSLDKVDGPGDQFFMFQDPDAPMLFAILPAPFSEVAKIWEKSTVYKVKRTPLDDEFNELLPKTDELTMLFPESVDEAKALARKLNCDYIYWSEWDLERMLMVTDAHYNGSVWKDPSLEYYYDGIDQYE